MTNDTWGLDGWIWGRRSDPTTHGAAGAHLLSFRFNGLKVIVAFLRLIYNRGFVRTRQGRLDDVWTTYGCRDGDT